MAEVNAAGREGGRRRERGEGQRERERERGREGEEGGQERDGGREGSRLLLRPFLSLPNKYLALFICLLCRKAEGSDRSADAAQRNRPGELSWIFRAHFSVIFL